MLCHASDRPGPAPLPRPDATFRAAARGLPMRGSRDPGGPLYRREPVIKVVIKVVRKVVRKVVTLGDHLQPPKPPPALVICSVPESDYPPPTLLRAGSLTRGAIRFAGGAGGSDVEGQKGPWQRASKALMGLRTA